MLACMIYILLQSRNFKGQHMGIQLLFKLCNTAAGTYEMLKLAF